jgi:diacylglycerol O-acyltransferase
MAQEDGDSVSRMSDLEALMWNLEKDPFLASTFTNITVLDQPPDRERLRRRLARAALVVPRLRQRVEPALGRLAPPEWRDDPEFDIDYHVRALAVLAPGTHRQLLDLSRDLAQTPLDRTRPLWRFTAVEGLEGGRGALVQQVHHAVTDGEGAVRMSLEFTDASRDQPDPPPVSPPVADARNTRLLATAAATFGHDVRRQMGAAERAAGRLADLLRNPELLPGVGAEALATLRSVMRQTMVADPAHSPLWTQRSLRRSFETLQVPFSEAKETAARLGGTINDFFVTGALGGADVYHRALGSEVDELRISMPVSTRGAGTAADAANAFAPARTLLPVVATDPAARFQGVRDRLAVAKKEQALGIVGGLAGVLNLLPTSVLVRVARQQTETVDFAISNVRGAPFEVFIAGARVEANHPMGPTGGTAFNLTLLSYNGSLDMGLNVDTAAVEDPEMLRSCMADSFQELLSAGTKRTRRNTRKKQDPSGGAKAS